MLGKKAQRFNRLCIANECLGYDRLMSSKSQFSLFHDAYHNQRVAEVRTQETDPGVNVGFRPLPQTTPIAGFCASNSY
jgi:hypothetical protein